MTSQQRTPTRITESNGNSSTVPWRRVVDAIARKRGAVAPDRAVLVGISGIDASGKGFITQNLAEGLRKGGWNVAALSADDWLNLPDVCIVCINSDNYAEHFYEHAIRFDEMFEQLIIPLKENRGISLTADCADAKATRYRKQCYDFREIEGLSPAETIKAFETIYFPAQRIHLARDKPREAADFVFTNENL